MAEVQILCVDDEPAILKALKRLFIDNDYAILTATSGEEGLEVLSRTPTIQVVVSDYRMPGMDGVSFLRQVCRGWPDTVRIVLSGYADTASVIAAINEGEIYRFIPKPWNDDELKVSIANAIEHYTLHQKNLELNRELLQKNEELRMINEHLEQLVRERTQELIFQNLVLRKSQHILDTLPLAVIGLDLTGLIVHCNHRATALFAGAILGLDRKDVFPEQMNAVIETIIARGDAHDRVSLRGADRSLRGVLMQGEEGQQGVVLVIEEI